LPYSLLLQSEASRQCAGMAEVRSCPACGNSDFTDLFSATDYLVSRETFSVRKCTACGLTFTADPPDEKDIGRYYLSGDYISHSDKKRNLTEHLYHLARRFMLARKQRLVERTTGKRGGTILDIGSGTGYFASFMHARGWKVTGLELNKEAREYSIQKFGINALAPSDVNLITDGWADCVTFWHVLEHLSDPGGWMKEVKRILKGNGKCIIAVPNIKSADALFFGKEWAALDVPRHLWHFSPDTMLPFIKNEGFTCEEIRPMPLDVFYISILSYRNTGKSMALMRGLLTGLYLTVGRIFRRNRASSLIYVISKQSA
jgi:SAM-dependent methyltransferase